MKLASLRRGGRDGSLIVVDRTLRTAVLVPQIAHTLQEALERWDELAPRLLDVYQRLNAGGVAVSFALDPMALAAPLPRAHQFLDASAYVTHVELVRKARGAELPPRFWTDPLMYQGASDAFLGPRDAIPLIDPGHGLDFEAEIAVISADVACGASPEEAGARVRLLTLVNDVSLRNVIPSELEKGFGFLHGKPHSALGAVAVTPDELGSLWREFKVCAPLRSHLNGGLFGEPDAGVDMTFDFARLLAHAAATRPLAAGTVLGSGTVSNRDRNAGSSCIAERRMLELLEHGEAQTPFLKDGDRVRIELLDAEGRSVFGAIDQHVRSLG